MKRNLERPFDAVTSPAKKVQKTLSFNSEEMKLSTVSATHTIPSSATFSKKIHDRQSVFMGIYVPLTTPSSIASFMKNFKNNPILEGSDHVITAHKVRDAFTAEIHAGSDDDGERFAGKKLLNLMEQLHIEGLLLCVRWYGGTMLGPIRFDHIINCARDAYFEYRKLRDVAQTEELRLRRILGARDKTIDALRQAIHIGEEDVALKKNSDNESACISSSQDHACNQPQKSPRTIPDYSKMSSETMKRLLTARDLSIKSMRIKLQGLQTEVKAVKEASVEPDDSKVH